MSATFSDAMDDNVKNMKSLRMENLSDIIAGLREQKEDLISQLNDLKKVRVGLEAKSEQADAVFYQLSDVKAKLKENLAMTKKKLDDAVKTKDSLQTINTICSDKIKEYLSKYQQETRDLKEWISEWGENVTEKSKEFMVFADLYKYENLVKKLKERAEEETELLEKVDRLKHICCGLASEKTGLTERCEDVDTVSHFLASEQAGEIIAMLEKAIDENSCYLKKEATLQEKKKLLQEWLDKHIRNEEVAPA